MAHEEIGVTGKSAGCVTHDAHGIDEAVDSPKLLGCASAERFDCRLVSHIDDLGEDLVASSLRHDD